MRSQRGRTTARSRALLEIAMWIIVLAVELVSWPVLLLHALASVGCQDDCRYDLLAVSSWISIGGTALGLGVAVVLRIVLSRRNRPGFWAPLVAAVILIVTLVASFSIQQLGYSPMYERNDRMAGLF